MNKTGRSVLLLVLPLLPLSQLAAQSQHAPTFKVVEVFDLPPTFLYPSVQGINSKGTVVGYYEDTTHNFNVRGYVRTRTGIVTTLDYPAPNLGTYASDINGRNTVCGEWVSTPANTASHGFFYTAGTYSSFDAPNAQYTQIRGINDAGDFVGTYGLPASNFVSFVDLGGVFTTLDLGLETVDAAATGISSNGLVAGDYVGVESGVVHGFLRAADGTITSLDYPGATSPGTLPTGINAKGWVVGFFGRRTGDRAFLFLPPNEFVNYVYPGATSTGFFGITDQDLIIGSYTDTNGLTHGIKVQVVQ